LVVWEAIARGGRKGKNREEKGGDLRNKWGEEDAARNDKTV